MSKSQLFKQKYVYKMMMEKYKKIVSSPIILTLRVSFIAKSLYNNYIFTIIPLTSPNLPSNSSRSSGHNFNFKDVIISKKGVLFRNHWNIDDIVSERSGPLI